VSSEVGAGHVAIFPVFKGMRSLVRKEVTSTVKDADKVASRGLKSTGERAGRDMGKGLKDTFTAATKDLGSKAMKTFEADVRRTTSALSRARLQELDAIGKVRVAEAKLSDARKKYPRESARVVEAEERMAGAVRMLEGAQERTATSTDDLRRAQKKLADAADDAGDELAEAGRRGGSRFASGFKGVFTGSFFGSFFGTSLTGALTSAGYAIGQGIRKGIEFGLGTIDIASDLGESVNAVQVAYGKASDTVLALGDDSVNAFGLSKRNLNAFATQFSGFASTIRKDNPAGFLEELMTRGADFASVYNLEVGEALALFQSGLAGETEPLRKYAVDLSAAAVEAHAYASGIADSGSELTEQQKQQARYSLLLKRTAKVQGDFANTGDSYANRTKKNVQTWDDLQAMIGQGFLPMATTFAGIMSERVLPAIQELVEKHGPGLAQMFEDALPSFVQMVEDILPKLPELFDGIATYIPIIMDGIATFGPPLLDLFGKFATGAQQINDFFAGIDWGDESAWDNWALGAQQIGDFFTIVGERMTLGAEQWGGFFGGVDTWLTDMGGKFALGGQQISGFFATVGERFALGAAQIAGFFSEVGRRFSLGLQQIGGFARGVGEKVGEVVSWFQQLPGRIGMALVGIGTWLYTQGRSLVQGFLNGIGSMWSTIGDTVGGVVDFITGFFPRSPAKRGPLSGSGWTNLKRSGSAIMGQVTAGMESASTSPISRAVGRLAAVSGQLTATTAGASVSGPGSLTAARGGSGGDTYVLNGITTREAAAEIAHHVDERRRRRVARTTALATARRS
jgi:hypothetical protein